MAVFVYPGSTAFTFGGGGGSGGAGAGVSARPQDLGLTQTVGPFEILQPVWGLWGPATLGGNYLLSGGFEPSIGQQVQDGQLGSYYEMQFSQEDGDATLRFNTGVVLPPGFTQFGNSGLAISTKLFLDTAPTDSIMVTLSLYSPADNTTVIASASRTKVGADADYVTTTISAVTLNALGLVAGDNLFVGVAVEPVVWGGGGGNNSTVRYGLLLADLT